MLICDSQVHAPDRPRTGRAGGIDPSDLLREMAGAGVDRCVVVPLEAPGDDQSSNNGAALDMADAHPDVFAVMGRFDVTRPEKAPLLKPWRQRSGMLGVRMTFLREPNLSLFVNDELDWFWTALEQAEIPVMLLAPGLTDKIDRIATRHARLRLVIDHLNLTPYQLYDDLLPLVETLRGISHRANVAVKASCLPSSTRDTFPFRALHEPIRRVVELFGPRRVFWGSDLTRLPCSYSECLRLFTEVMPFTSDEREWILGRGVMEWLGWGVRNPGRSGTAARTGS